MSQVEDFLTTEQEQAIIKAIQNAEKNTSGEIRVHIEQNTEKPPVERALEVFYMLKMNETELKNGVLFYVAVKSKKFALIGDEGIHNKVPENFWDTSKELVLSHFSKESYTEGLVLGITEVGKKLKAYFPHQKNDINELPDEISKG